MTVSAPLDLRYNDIGAADQVAVALAVSCRTCGSPPGLRCVVVAASEPTETYRARPRDLRLHICRRADVQMARDFVAHARTRPDPSR
jgi:hypothetical protein